MIRWAIGIFLSLTVSAFAAAFTPVVDGVVVQDADFLNEIIDSANERYAAGVGSTNGAIPQVAAGDYIQGKTFFNNIQSRIQSAVPYFVDHTQTIEGGTNVVMFTWGTNLWSNCSMTNGWRRAQSWVPPADPTWLSEGAVQVGDIINGYWIWDDFQDVCSALKWTLDERGYGVGDRTNYSSRTASDLNNATRDDAWDDGEAAWSAASWTGTAPAASYYYFSGTLATDGQWDYTSTRVKSQPILASAFVPYGLDFDWEVFADGYWVQDNPETNDYNWAEGVYYSHDSGAGISNNFPVIASYIGDIDSSAVALLTTRAETNQVSTTWFTDTMTWIKKWNFSYSN